MTSFHSLEEGASGRPGRGPTTTYAFKIDIFISAPADNVLERYHILKSMSLHKVLQVSCLSFYYEAACLSDPATEPDFFRTST